MRNLTVKGKRLLMAVAVAMAVVATSGCDVDAEFSSPVVVDNIPILPNDWKTMLFEDGQFDYYYFDVPLREITPEVFDTGSYATYWRYGERRDGVNVDVQEPLPAVIKQINYIETISCSYDVGYVRIMISRSPSTFNFRPDKTLYFRTVVFR